jgi:TPR repeat protein
MRRSRTIALVSLALLAAAVLLYLLLHSPPRPVAKRSPAAGTTVQRLPPPGQTPPAPAPAASPAEVARTDDSSGGFTRRLRCTQGRLFLGRTSPPEVPAALCDRKPLSALKILVPLAEAGDLHAVKVLAFLAEGGSCDTYKPVTAASREILVSLARARGAAPQTLRRLDDLLAEEQAGPTPDELEACRQSLGELKKLHSGVLRQFTDTLGRSEQTLRGENELDVGIEYERRMLVHGDADGEDDLAMLLLQKATPESQREAMALLREAASTLPSAKSRLAECLLRGCPTPASDPTEARQLLRDAAAAGDLSALMTLAGPMEPTHYDSDPSLPAPERYAWGQFLQRLSREGCFGAAQYSTWATSGEAQERQSSLLAMSPADASAAQARAAALIGAQLDRTRQLLGCD